MSELNLGPAQESSPLKYVLLAFGILLLIGAAVFFLNPRKTAEVTVLKTQLYGAHTTFKADPGSVHVIGQGSHVEDDLYVVATIRVEDKLRLPLFVNSVTATAIIPEGQLDTRAPDKADLARIEESFPALTPLMLHPIDGDTQIAPGEAVEGTVLLHFSGLTEANWKARKSASLSVNLAHQQPQTAPMP